MNTFEETAAFGDPREPLALEKMDKLMHVIELRFAEAADKAGMFGGVVWLGNESVEDSGEFTEWYRLASDVELRPGVEQFDIGVVVAAPTEDRPHIALQEPDAQHFYVSRYIAGQKIVACITRENVDEYFGDAIIEGAPPLIRDLPQKIRDYKMTIIRTLGTPPASPIEEILDCTQ